MTEAQEPVPRQPVLVLARYFEPAFRAGGPVRTLSALIDQANQLFDVRVITTNRDLKSSEPLAVAANVWVNRDSATVFYADASKPLSIFSALRSARPMHPGIVYVNSFFDLKFALLPILLCKFRFFGKTQLLVAPRGEFGSGALGLKSAPKRLFLALFNFSRMGKEIVWHASTELEASDIRGAVPRAEKFVIKEDETHLPTSADAAQESEARPLRAVFLSRISPMKGLDVLLQSLEKVDTSVSLDVYGAVDDNEYLQECLALAGRLGEKVKVTFRGEVPHEDVRETLASYDLMILSTRGENFGHIIAEALSVSVPVMCSRHTPWTETLVAGGGVVVPQDSPDAWTSAVTDYAALSSAERNSRKRSAGKAYDQWAKKRDLTSIFERIAEKR